MSPAGLSSHAVRPPAAAQAADGRLLLGRLLAENPALLCPWEARVLKNA
ncbi:hypothetical protein [Geodermatophilus ruber]|nr:hypothetical protein [Geodermatophilus ruber]